MTQVILSASGSGTWTVPLDCTSITVQCLGAGSDGINGPGGALLGGSGGAGAEWVGDVTISVTPGAAMSFQVGARNHGKGNPTTPTLSDTWFGSTSTIFAQGAGLAPNAGGGGNPDTYGPGTHHRGGSAPSSADIVGSTGGAGAGGPHGVGADGGGVELFPYQSGGGGGGGADGGSVGGTSTGAPGAAGGNNRLGAGAGTGAATGAANGGAGTAGAGAGGGYGYHDDNTPPKANTSGGAGSFEDLWNGYGPGSGGGGAGIDAGNGGDAGGRGGGGGGPGFSGIPGLGTNGLIVITYRGSGSADGRGRVYTRYIKTRTGGPRPPPAPPPTAPVNTGAPVMNQARVGVVSTCSPGTWTGTAPITFAYQWKVDGSNVGTNSRNYTPVSGDNTKSLTCTVTATNGVNPPGVQVSNTLTVSTSVGPSIDIPDADALWAALEAWPTTGNKTWLLTGASYGTLGIYSRNFISAPVIIDGLGTAKFEYGELDGASGFTLQNMAVPGTHPSFGGALAVHSDNVFPCVLTFNNITYASDVPMGTQSGGGLILRNLDGSTITINGKDDATQADFYGRTFGIGLTNVGENGGSILINGVTFDNININNIVGGAASNVTTNRCLFTNTFYGDGDHPNAIHFFGVDGRPSRNITNTNNGIWQGLYGGGPAGIFLEGVEGVVNQNNWVLSGGQNNAFANGAGSGNTNDNNFAQGVGVLGGDMIARNGAVDSVNTNNTVCGLTNYTADGINPDYVPGAVDYPGSNTLIPAASSVTDYTYLDPWLAAHPTARSRP